MCAQALEEQASGCEAGVRASEGREAAASLRADALKQGIAQMWERLGCQALGLEELLGDEGITDTNLMQHLGIIEQRASQLLQVLCCPGSQSIYHWALPLEYKLLLELPCMVVQISQLLLA